MVMTMGRCVHRGINWVTIGSEHGVNLTIDCDQGSDNEDDNGYDHEDDVLTIRMTMSDQYIGGNCADRGDSGQCGECYVSHGSGLKQQTRCKV